MSLNEDLRRAVKHLLFYGLIESRQDVVDKLGISKGSFSEYYNGKEKASKNFRTKFEEAFNIKLKDFEQDASHHNYTLDGAGAIYTLKDYIELLREYKDKANSDKDRILTALEKVASVTESINTIKSNSNETLKRLEKVLLFDRADHETIMNSQDRAEHLPPGTSKKAAGSLAVAKAKRLQKRDKNHQRDGDR